VPHSNARHHHYQKLGLKGLLRRRGSRVPEAGAKAVRSCAAVCANSQPGPEKHHHEGSASRSRLVPLSAIESPGKKTTVASARRVIGIRYLHKPQSAGGEVEARFDRIVTPAAKVVAQVEGPRHLGPGGSWASATTASWLGIFTDPGDARGTGASQRSFNVLTHKLLRFRW
jgi:hypothetical protein